MARSLRVLVAFGGPSPEHEVSVLTAMQILAALKETPHTATPLYIAKNGRWFTGEAFSDLSAYKDLPALVKSGMPCSFAHDGDGRAVLRPSVDGGWFSKPAPMPVDIVIPAFHGGDGENGAFQGVCDVFNLPYTSAGVTASAVGMDKRLAKAICRAYGYPVVDDIHIRESEWAAGADALITQAEALGYPLFVKPIHLGSSIGVSRADDRDSLSRAIEEAFRYDPHLLVEKGVAPLTEINCSVVGTADGAEASVCEQPVGSSELLSFRDKYQSGEPGKGMASAGRRIPAPIPDAQSDEIRRLAVDIFKALGCAGVARLDFLVNRDTGAVYFNEINTQPGSFSFYLWQHQGLGFPALLERILADGMATHRLKNGRVRSYETNLLSEKAAKGLKGLKGVKGSKA
jgi:D-alanine-D-alanine ligase